MHFKETKYGFEWGAAKVERLCSHKEQGWVYVGVESPKAQIQVYVTKSGKVRIYKQKKRKGVFIGQPEELHRAIFKCTR